MKNNMLYAPVKLRENESSPVGITVIKIKKFQTSFLLLFSSTSLVSLVAHISSETPRIKGTLIIPFRR